MLHITTQTEEVIMPTDFKIRITTITDPDGNPTDVATAEFYFKFYVGDYGPYIVSDSQNSRIEHGKLYFIFQDYPFRSRGVLRYKQLTRVPDPGFKGGMQDIWTEGKTNIVLK